jgi:lysyl-tRNA synthetase class I
VTERREAFARLLRERRVDSGDPRAELALELLADARRPLAEAADELAMLLRWHPAPRGGVPWTRRALDALRTAVREAPELDVDAAAVALGRAVRLSGLGRQTVGHAVRLALSGRSRGPDLARLIAVLGRDETLRRLDAAVDDRVLRKHA